jgi:hypothetical protein
MRPIPTLAQLYADILADLQVAFGVTIFTFGRVFLRALAAVQAGKLYLYYLTQANLQKNIFVDTADTEAIGGTLERFGRVKINRNPFAARAGQYVCTVTGTTGSTIRANSTFKSDDTSAAPGFLYVLDALYTMPGATGSITVRALTLGIDAKLAIGNTLTATAPIAGVDSIITITAVAIEPAAAEDIERYREVVLDSYRTEPQGGAATDYRIWANDAQGVQRVYPYAASGLVSEINLYVEATVADSTDGKGTPSALLLADVEAVVEFDPDTTRPLNERGRRPLQAIVNFIAITPLNIDIVITNYSGLTPTIQTLITNAVTDAVNAVRPFVSAADILSDKNDILDQNKIIAAIISAQPGSIFTSVQLSVSGAPTASYTFINGNIPYFNSITFV